jgi:hypothetical protein
MSAFNDEIDLDVLQYALQNHADRIPPADLQTLLRHLQAFQQQQPGAAEQLCQFAMQSEGIDLAYDLALTELRRQYQTQQRAKGAILTAQHQGQLNGFNQITDTLILQLETILNPPAPRSRTTKGENFDRIAIMGAGGAFLGGAIVQFLGGGASQFIGAAIGLVFGIASGFYATPRPQERSGRH